MNGSAVTEKVEQLLDEAEDTLEQGNPEAALTLTGEARQLIPGHPGALFVQGDALRTLGHLDQAVEAYRAAALGRPDHSASWASLALTCFELLRFDEARRACRRALREDPRNPEGWWIRSLLQERRGDRAGARRSLVHAFWLDPDGFILPPTLTDEEIESIVEESIQLLHPTLREYLANVAIVLEDVPAEESLRQYDPPASPLELLGLFRGSALPDASTMGTWGQIPGSIVLFRRNLERHAQTRGELIEELCVTFFHEVGHFLGLSEEDLVERGLD